MTATATGRAHIYCRVSSAAQEDGYSLSTQEAAARQWCADHKFAVASVAREVWSGSVRHRPALDALLDRLGSGDVVLAYALDRVSRKQVDIAVLVDLIERAGARLELVTEDFEQSATGVFLRGAKAFAAELEREKIAERTQRGRRARVDSGKPLVGRKAPYGYRWADDEKSHLALDPETAPVVRRLFEWALAGISLRETVHRLADLGIPSPTGKPRWSISPIRDILRRRVYTGEAAVYASRTARRPAADVVMLPDIAPPIVTPEEQAAVVARLAENKEQAARNNRDREATLLRAGFLTCGHCGQALTVTHRPTRLAGSSPQYRCGNRRDGCLRPTITASLLDGAVWQQVATVLADPAIIAREVERRHHDGSLQRDLAALEARIAALTDKQARTARRIADFADDEIAAPLMAALKAFSAESKAAAAERDDLLRRMADRAEEDARVRSLAAWCSHVGANLDALGYDEKRLALRALGVKVHIYRNGTTDEEGTPCPRWELTMRPLALRSDIVNASIRPCATPSTRPPANRPC